MIQLVTKHVGNAFLGMTYMTGATVSTQLACGVGSAQDIVVLTWSCLVALLYCRHLRPSCTQASRQLRPMLQACSRYVACRHDGHRLSQH
jgi:hypothetical protein